MTKKTWYDGYIINSDTHEAVPSETAGCTDCAFWSESYRGDGCANHACFSQDFPNGHPLRNSIDIIWIEKVAS